MTLRSTFAENLILLPLISGWHRAEDPTAGLCFGRPDSTYRCRTSLITTDRCSNAKPDPSISPRSPSPRRASMVQLALLNLNHTTILHPIRTMIRRCLTVIEICSSANLPQNEPAALAGLRFSSAKEWDCYVVVTTRKGPGGDTFLIEGLMTKHWDLRVSSWPLPIGAKPIRCAKEHDERAMQ